MEVKQILRKAENGFFLIDFKEWLLLQMNDRMRASAQIIHMKFLLRTI